MRIFFFPFFPPTLLDPHFELINVFCVCVRFQLKEGSSPVTLVTPPGVH